LILEISKGLDNRSTNVKGFISNQIKTSKYRLGDQKKLKKKQPRMLKSKIILISKY
jgi:ribosomal protein L30E